MKRTIELIWKDGFLKEETLVAPKVNDLYNRKSNDIIEQFQRKYRNWTIELTGYSLLILVISFFDGWPFIGLSLSVLVIISIVYMQKDLVVLKSIEKNQNSYQYLSEYGACIKKIISDGAWIGRLVFPAVFLLSITFLLFLNPNTNTMLANIMNNPDTYLYYGIPVLWVFGVVFTTLFLFYFGERLYFWAIKLSYGRLMKKLDRTLREMEELINSSNQ